MRQAGEIEGALHKISQFEQFGNAILGLNLSESIQISEVLGILPPNSSSSSLEEAAIAIREKLGVSTVLIHPIEKAACATPEGSYSVDGPYCVEPMITTGAGDHLNAGFCLAQLLGLSPTESLQLGVLYSGYYVRTGKSPSFEEIIHFISQL